MAKDLKDFGLRVAEFLKRQAKESVDKNEKETELIKNIESLQKKSTVFSTLSSKLASDKSKEFLPQNAQSSIPYGAGRDLSAYMRAVGIEHKTFNTTANVAKTKLIEPPTVTPAIDAAKTKLIEPPTVTPAIDAAKTKLIEPPTLTPIITISKNKLFSPTIIESEKVQQFKKDLSNPSFASSAKQSSVIFGAGRDLGAYMRSQNILHEPVNITADTTPKTKIVQDDGKSFKSIAKDAPKFSFPTGQQILNEPRRDYRPEAFKPGMVNVNYPGVGNVPLSVPLTKPQLNEVLQQSKLDSLKDALNALNDTVKKTNTEAKTRAATSGGGGDGGGFGGGLIDFIKDMGRKDRLGFRGGMAGLALQTVGNIAGAGLTGYFNYQSQMAQAPVQTYANIASLQGFQQRRFLRDFTDYSPEALILRSPNLRYNPAEDISRRIDKVARETTEKKDVAETQNVLKDIATKVGSQVVGGITQGAFSGGGIKGAAAGGVGAGIGAIANELANAPNNPVLMRTGLAKTLAPDLFLKNKTQFEAENIQANTRMLENAVIESSAIDIEILRKQMQTIAPRTRAMQEGRFTDLTKLYQNTFGAMGAFNRMSEVSPLSFRDQSRQLSDFAQGMNNPLTGPRGFTEVLSRMGYSMGDEEGIRLMTQFANIGGAGAGTPSPKSFQSLERIRQMAFSGRGPVDQLLGQAGILGRISGGVSAEQNIKKLEEVMSRAVAIGMDNSELGSAFVQNVTNMSQQLKTTDISSVAKLVQQMQSAGGGQLIDFQRMQRSFAQYDVAREQNVAIKTFRRENIANVLERFGITGEAALPALMALPKMTTAEQTILPDTLKKYLDFKTKASQAKDKKSKEGYEAEAEKIKRGASENIRDLITTSSEKQLRIFASDQFKSSLGDATSAADVAMTPEKFKERFKILPSEFKNLPEDKQKEILREYQKLRGGGAGAAEDVLLGRMGKTGTAAATDTAKVKAADTALAVQKAQAESTNALLAAGKLEKSFGKTFTETQNKFQYWMDNPAIAKYFSGAEKQALSRLADQGALGGVKDVDVSKFSKEEKSAFEKATQLSEMQLRGAGDVKPVSDRPGGMTTSDATALGDAFADAFFKRIKPEGKNPVLEAIIKFAMEPTPERGSTINK